VSNHCGCNTIDCVSTSGTTTAASRVIAVIPARLASSRLPRKVLRTIAGRPMLAWVVEAARACPQLDDVIVATDSDEVAGLCAENGWQCRMTSPDLQSGTDRMHAVALEIEADIYVNVQGDEPLLRPEHITALLAPFADAATQVSTLRVACTMENIHNPNAVKVVTDTEGRALYFSRATVPYNRDGAAVAYWKHIGLYAYRRAALLGFPTLPTSLLERTERLEQLRFLENGIAIHVATTEFDTIGVDTEQDLKRVEAILSR
jgi:3-deoxy-manno-octulosonate cytidylyltransferase (CMP-KDO synthetase)